MIAVLPMRRLFCATRFRRIKYNPDLLRSIGIVESSKIGKPVGTDHNRKCVSQI